MKMYAQYILYVCMYVYRIGIRLSVLRGPDSDLVLCVYRQHNQPCYTGDYEQVTFNAYSHLTHNIY